MNTAFVTGGSGFVGGRLIPALRSRGVEVKALARSDAAVAAVEALGATAVRGDLDDRAARFVWIAGGHYLTSTAHVDNVVEGLLLAAERGTPGAIYFVTDGAPVEFRAFVTRWLGTQGIDPGTRSIPRWLARLVASATAWMKTPPMSKSAFAVIAHEVTIDDGKARRELGYQGTTSVEAGLAEMCG